MAKPDYMKADHHKDIRWTFFPYVLQQCDDGSWLLLNRDYKPTTLTGIRVKLTWSQRKALSYKPLLDGERGIYLYNDGCNPRLKRHQAAYFHRLALLMKLVPVVEGPSGLSGESSLRE